MCCNLSNPVLKLWHNHMGEAHIKIWKILQIEIPHMREFLCLWGKIQKAF